MLRRVIVVPEATRKVQGRSVYLVAITENPVTSVLVFCIVHCRGNRVHSVNCLSQTSYPLTVEVDVTFQSLLSAILIKTASCGVSEASVQMIISLIR